MRDFLRGFAFEAGPKLVFGEPFLDEVAKRGGGGRIFPFGPDHVEFDVLLRGKRAKAHGPAEAQGGDAVGENADAGAGFDVGENGAHEAGIVNDAGREPGVAAAFKNGIVQAHAFATGEDDERLLGEIGPLNNTAASERMRLGKGGPERFPAEEEGLEAKRFLRENRTREANGQAPARDHFPDSFRGALLKDDRDAGMPFSIFAENGAEKKLRGGADVTEPKFAFLAGGDSLSVAEGFVEALEEQLDVVEEGGSGGGEFDGAAGAGEEGDAEMLFEFLDGAAEGGLGDAETGGGAGEAEFLGNSLEIFQMTELDHRFRVSYSGWA